MRHAAFLTPVNQSGRQDSLQRKSIPVLQTAVLRVVQCLCQTVIHLAPVQNQVFVILPEFVVLKTHLRRSVAVITTECYFDVAVQINLSLPFDGINRSTCRQQGNQQNRNHNFPDSVLFLFPIQFSDRRIPLTLVISSRHAFSLHGNGICFSDRCTAPCAEFHPIRQICPAFCTEHEVSSCPSDAVSHLFLLPHISCRTAIATWTLTHEPDPFFKNHVLI